MTYNLEEKQDLVDNPSNQCSKGVPALLRELTLSEKLLLLRGNQPQNVVARGAGVAPATLCRLERGQRGRAKRAESALQRAETLRRLATYYGVLPEYLNSDMRTYLQAWATTNLSAPSLRTPAERLRSVVAELERRFNVGNLDLAQELVLSERDLNDYLSGVLPISEAMGNQLEELTGIPFAWISQHNRQLWDTSAYERPLSLAAAGGVPPDVLEDLVRNWLSSNRGERKTP